MPAREQLLSELTQENDFGVLLVTQMGGAPNELQLVIETAEFDPVARGLRPRHAYAIRVLGEYEHRIQLGMFKRLAILDDHPLLYHTNTPRVAVHFDGKAADINELALDISQMYVSVFQNWRHLVDQEDDINRTIPLIDLLKRGYGLLGTMPKPLAEKIGRVLAHHHVKFTLAEEVGFSATDGKGRSQLAKVLLMDDSYFIALDFSVEQMGVPR